MTLPLPPMYEDRHACNVCGGCKQLEETKYVDSWNYIPIEWTCTPCIKALQDARAQQKYLKQRRK